MHRMNDQHPPTSILSLAASCALVCATSSIAAPQTLTPIERPASIKPPNAVPTTPPPAPLPPPLSVAEQRFRELSARIRAQGAMTGPLRADVVALCPVLDADLDAPTTSREIALRLLAARVQCAMWLEDDAAIDSSFRRLSEMNPASEATVVAWARELINAARFERAVELLQSRPFAAKAIDAKIALGDALIGLHRFDEAQAEFNTAPGGRSPAQQKAISDGTFRTQALRAMFERELVAIDLDQRRDDLPLVEFMTSRGPIEIELFEEQAPNTVGNFIEHIEAGTYDGTTFHRRLRGLGVQGGDPATASGAAGGRSTGGWTIPDECERTDRRAPLAGYLVMAKQTPTTGARELPTPNSAGCQFVILHAPMDEIDGRYTVYGRVTSGLEIARELTAEDTAVAARVVRKRDHDYKGVRLSTAAEGDFAMPRSKAEGGNRLPPAPPAATSGAAGAPAGGMINLGPTPNSKPTPPKPTAP
jgi:peptidyl-prolyl cis-trans isomerase B (cyclophilin B)